MCRPEISSLETVREEVRPRRRRLRFSKDNDEFSRGKNPMPKLSLNPNLVLGNDLAAGQGFSSMKSDKRLIQARFKAGYRVQLPEKRIKTGNISIFWR